MSRRTFILSALGAAILFGASTPLAKSLAGELSPVLLAGLLYLGSGVGLWAVLLPKGRSAWPLHWSRAEWGWFAGAIVSGGILAPILLMYGLKHLAAADASLLLNLETVFTALIAWMVFREHTERRIVLGMISIVGGGLALAWPADGVTARHSLVGALAVAGACLCWGADNNLTRKVSAADARFIAGTKGLVAGVANLTVALLAGTHLPSVSVLLKASGLGLIAYGISLVLYVLALRGLGAARTSAYFATAPFIGTAIAVGLLHEPVSAGLVLAAALMLAGVGLHVIERHEHEHTHEPLTHTHRHRHDEHHRHEHAFAWDGKEPHTHEHRHEDLTHSHPHYPDVHHQHAHVRSRA